VHRGYWIDIGTPEKYMQVHQDIMDGRYQLEPFRRAPNTVFMAPDAKVEEGAVVEGPCYVGDGAIVKAGARIGAHTVLGRQCHVEEQANVQGSIVWAGTRIGQAAVVKGSILGRQCHVGRSATLGPGLVLGDKSVVTDYSRL
jgi:NDP-sugar pyrophosphorylase family protein